MYVNLLRAYKILWFVTIVERGYVDSILAFHVLLLKQKWWVWFDWLNPGYSNCFHGVIWPLKMKICNFLCAIFIGQNFLHDPKKMSTTQLYFNCSKIFFHKANFHLGYDVFGINKIWCRTFFSTNVQELEQSYPDPLCGPLAMTMASKIVCKLFSKPHP